MINKNNNKLSLLKNNEDNKSEELSNSTFDMTRDIETFDKT